MPKSSDFYTDAGVSFHMTRGHKNLKTVGIDYFAVSAIDIHVLFQGLVFGRYFELRVFKGTGLVKSEALLSLPN